MGGGAAAQALALASGREDKGKKRAADEGGRDEVRRSTRPTRFDLAAGCEKLTSVSSRARAEAPQGRGGRLARAGAQDEGRQGGQDGRVRRSLSLRLHLDPIELRLTRSLLDSQRAPQGRDRQAAGRAYVRLSLLLPSLLALALAHQLTRSLHRPQPELQPRRRRLDHQEAQAHRPLAPPARARKVPAHGGQAADQGQAPRGRRRRRCPERARGVPQQAFRGGEGGAAGQEGGRARGEGRGRGKAAWDRPQRR